MFKLHPTFTAPTSEVEPVFTYYPNLDTEFDPIQAAADFYVLFGLLNKNIVEFPTIELVEPRNVIDSAITLGVSLADLRERNRKFFKVYSTLPSVRLTSLASDAGHLLENLLDRTEPVLIDYSMAAIGGELRHHQNVQCLGKGSEVMNRLEAWSIWGSIFLESGWDILLEAVDLFRDFPANSSYGGEPWANAAQLLYDRVTGNLGATNFDNSCVFVDRVFNMQHNTGSFLNKFQWACLRSSPYNESLHMMADTVLKAHGLNPPDLNVLAPRASSSTVEILDKTVEIARENNLIINAVYGSNND